MEKIRAKFVCERVVKYRWGTEEAELKAVTNEGENKEWAEATPAGDLTISISNKTAQGFFEAGKEYFLDFTRA